MFRFLLLAMMLLVTTAFVAPLSKVGTPSVAPVMKLSEAAAKAKWLKSIDADKATFKGGPGPKVSWSGTTRHLTGRVVPSKNPFTDKERVPEEMSLPGTIADKEQAFGQYLSKNGLLMGEFYEV